jgi:CO/xanthine dehydrogenase FAD-binding subunit
MISFDFEYCRPDSINEAFELYHKSKIEKKNPVYYSGGTEIIALCRKNLIKPGIVIDLKGISECRELSLNDKIITYGSCLSLTEIIDDNNFPLLTKILKGIADHTVRNRLTIGGNICGRLPYREAILPFLLGNTHFIIASYNGIRKVHIDSIFDKRLKLEEGEFIVQIIVDRHTANSKFVSIRKEKHGEIDYPLLNLASVKINNNIKLSMTGIGNYPFRSIEIENVLNDTAYTSIKRVEKILSLLPSLRQDQLASSEYRKILLYNSLIDILQIWEG